MAIRLLNELIYNANKSIAKPLQDRDRCFDEFREMHMLLYKVLCLCFLLYGTMSLRVEDSYSFLVLCLQAT